MTANRINTFDAWMRDVEKRLNRLERRPVQQTTVRIVDEDDPLLLILQGLASRVSRLEGGSDG